MSVNFATSSFCIYLCVVDTCQVIKGNLAISVEDKCRNNYVLVKVLNQQVKTFAVLFSVECKHGQTCGAILRFYQLVDLEIVQRFMLRCLDKLY